MSLAKQRGAKAIYVAASARDLPADVQTWLSRADNRATASNNIYDLLARLANGARPAAVIVHMSMVDWSEMEFFDLVHRLSPETNLYVTGQEHQREKIDAACERLAERFDASLLDDDLKRPGRMTAPSGLNDLVAGSAQSTDAAVDTRRAATPAPRAAEPDGGAGSIEEDDNALAETDTPPDDAPPNMRLVDAEPRAGESDEPPVPFPWRPAENRPQRTPPSKAPSGEQEPAEQAPKPSSESAQPPPEQHRAQRHTVNLTQEELEALIGKPLGLSDQSDKLFIGHRSTDSANDDAREQEHDSRPAAGPREEHP